ncbi:MAG TPA: hypothetical protein VFZ40_18775 [Pyrinomonadaceae bacterium]
MPSTQLNYDIVPDKSPLYTTVDQLNQSSTNLTFTATNAGKASVTIKAIEIELVKVVNGTDSVQLVLPGSAGAIGVPNSFIGPHNSAWTVTGGDGQFTLKPDEGTVAFAPGATLSFVLQNVVIREGGNGTALVPVFEETDEAKAQTPVGIGITQSTLNVQLSADDTLIEPNGSTTLKWTTHDASSGSLTLPGNSPSSITLDPSTDLTSGEQLVSPIVDTTYTLTCQGRGPNVSQQVTVSVDSLQMSEIETSTLNVPAAGAPVVLRWRTNADSCTLDDGSGNKVSVPTTVPNAQYSNGYVVTPEQPTTYTLIASKKLKDGDFITDKKAVSIEVPAVSLISFLVNGQSSFEASNDLYWNAVDDSEVTLGNLTWEAENASSCVLTCSFNPAVGSEYTTPEPVPQQGAKGVYLLFDNGNFDGLVTPKLTMTWTLTCNGYRGPVSQTVELIVDWANPDG